MKPHALCFCPRCCAVAVFAGRIGFARHALSLLATDTSVALAAVRLTAQQLGLGGEA